MTPVGAKSFGAPLRTPMYDPNTGIMNSAWQQYFSTQTETPTLSVSQFGAVGSKTVDNSRAFEAAWAAIQNEGGGILQVPGQADPYIIDGWDIKGTAPVEVVGQGQASLLKRGANYTGRGLIDFNANVANVSFRSLAVDGDTTVTQQLAYSDFGGNPLNPLLANNTSIWIHDGASNLRFDDIYITHTGGYSVNCNAENEDITDLFFNRLVMENNRPHTFGLDHSDMTFGSWTGGVLLHGNGLSSTAMCRRVSFLSCTARRCTGNAFWTHLYGFASLHESLTFTDCRGEDLGLDWILFGGVTGGTVTGGVGRRIGYVCVDDVSRSVPKWQNGKWAVGIDHSGLVINTNVTGVSLCSVNGGGMDCDGMAASTVAGCTVRVPRIGEPEHDEDQIGTPGWAGGGALGGDGPNFAYGIQTGNTSQNIGGSHNCIVGNSLINLSGGAIGIFAGQDAVVAANKIEHPADASFAPIRIGNTGPLPVQRSIDVVITANSIKWSPTIAKACIVEDESISAYVAGEVNVVMGNTIIPVSGLATEFSKSPTSDSIGSITHEVDWATFHGKLKFKNGFLIKVTP